MDNVTNAEAVVKRNLAREEEIRNIFLECYNFTEEGGNEAFKAAVILAVEVSLQLFNILLAIRRPDDRLAYKMGMDLAVNLNANRFWANNGAVIMPLLHVAMHAQSDYALLVGEKQQNPNSVINDEIMYESKLVGLEMFVLISHLLGGQAAMSIASGQLKRRLSIYLG